MKVIGIAVDRFNDLRKLSVEISDAVQSGAVQAATNLSSKMVNELIDIEDRYLDGQRPLGADENIGSCEPSPAIRWDKTQQTWHTDVENVGRYSVRRTGRHMPFGAFLNNKPLAIECHKDVAVVKRAVELRIVEARRIATAVPDPDGFGGYHKNGVGNSFHVFGQGDQWFWWQREPGNEPTSRSEGPHISAKDAYTAAMRNDD